MMLEFEICAEVILRSVLIDPCNRGGKANHERKATKNANQARWKVLPYLLIGLSMESVFDLLFNGLTSAPVSPFQNDQVVGAMYCWFDMLDVGWMDGLMVLGRVGSEILLSSLDVSSKQQYGK